MQTKHDDVAAELSRLDAGQEYAKLRDLGVPTSDAIQRVIKQMIDPHVPQPEDIHQEMQMFEKMATKGGQMPSYPWSTPEEYVPNIPMPGQQGSAPTTPHPIDSMDAIMGRMGIPGTDAGMGQGYNEALMQELLRPTIPGHMYQWSPRYDDPYGIDPGLSPLGGSNQENWYPGSGSMDRNDYWGDPADEPSS